MSKDISQKIKKFEDIIGERSLRTKPSLEDFEKGLIAIREDLANYILEELKTKHICLIVGPKNSGKTWLCYALGFKLRKAKKFQRFIEVDEDFNGFEIWKYISTQFKGKRREITYWFIEDCQNNREQIEDLIELFPQDLENLRFVFTMRAPLEGIFRDLSDEEKFEVRLGVLDEKTVEHVKEIIRKFINNKRVKDYVDVKEEEIDFVARKWGYDLNGVSLRLTHGWKFERGMKLSEVGDEYVYKSYWSHDGKIKLEIPERRNILLSLSALCQFEPLMVSSVFLYEINPTPNTIIELENEQLIQRREWRGKGFFIIPEEEAKMILRTVSKYISAQFVQSEIKKVFKKYIESKPPNWPFVFYYLYLAKDENNFTKEIFTSLLCDKKTWEIIKEIGKEYPLFDLIRFLDAISWMDPQQKYIQDFWLYYIQQKGVSAIKKEIYDLKTNTTNLYRLYTVTPINELKAEIISNLYKRLKSTNAKKINEELASLHKNWGVDFRSFFDTFSITDFVNIINRSTLRSIRTLFGNFIEHRKLVDAPFMLRFAEALVDERVDWGRLLTQGNPSLYRLCGLIQFVERISPQCAKVLISRLSRLDLNELLSRDDPEAMEKGVSKARSLNGLHTETYKLSIFHLWEEIIRKINDETWGKILHSSDLEQNLWLLFNIYRHNEHKAKQLVKVHEHFIKDNILRAKLPSNMLLVSLAILHLCGSDIQKIPISKIEVEEIKRILNELKSKDRPLCTQIVLSLVVLKIKLSPEQYQIFKDILKEPQVKKGIYNNDDPQLGKVLQKLIEYL